MKNKHLIRTGWDKLLQGGIRLCMLSAVAFTVTACYGLPPEERYWNYPDQPEQDSIQQDQQRQELEQRMADIAEQIEADETDKTAN